MSGVAVEDLFGLWSDELRGAKARLRPLFLQSCTAASAGAFLDGLLGPERRKTGWMRAEAAGDRGPWRQQAVLGRSSWDADTLRDVVRDYALDALAEPDATLVIDETGFLKQGKASCGVGRQYTGSAGKITNCQIGVFAAYVSSKGHAFIDRRLYLPKDWTGNPERLAKAHVPEDVRFATKPTIAAAMVRRAVDAEVPFAWVAADSVYGVGELEMALRRAGKGYVLGVTSSHHFNSWSPTLSVSGTAEEIAKDLPAESWIRVSAGNGTKGPRLYDWAYLELADLDPEMVGAPPGLGLWTRGLLVRRRPVDGERAFFTTWCRHGTPVDTLVRVEGQRWSVEDAFETAKTELGLDHNETRSWHGWHRHVSLVMLAFALLAVVRHKADTRATPPKTTRKGPCLWSVGRCRRSVVLPTA
jgi:SRSO17 transposase